MLIGVCCIGFLIADVATPNCFDDAIPALSLLGVVTAQLTVICVWGTLVRGTFWIRLPWTLLLLTLSWYAFAWGITIDKGASDINSILGVGLIWMFGFITSFVPLKIAAICFRWQIVQVSPEQRKAGRNSRYAIRDIMIGTLLLALVMGIGRAMLHGKNISFNRALISSGLDDRSILIPIVIYGIVSLFVKLPCIWISLGEKAEKIKSRIGLWVVYCFVLAISEIGLLFLVIDSLGPDSGEVTTGIIISHQLMGAIMLGVCLTLRGLGYRLKRSVNSEAAHAAEDQANPSAPVPDSEAPSLH